MNFKTWIATLMCLCSDCTALKTISSLRNFFPPSPWRSFSKKSQFLGEQVPPPKEKEVDDNSCSATRRPAYFSCLKLGSFSAGHVTGRVDAPDAFGSCGGGGGGGRRRRPVCLLADVAVADFLATKEEGSTQWLRPGWVGQCSSTKHPPPPQDVFPVVTCLTPLSKGH